MSSRPIVVLVALVAALALCPVMGWAGIVGSKHDLTASGSSSVKAFGEDEVCVFCHAPHNTTPGTPLWNRDLPARVYAPYSSSSLEAVPGQPTGASKLCLSCHDGTIALGSLRNRLNPVPMSGPLPIEADLTTDLSDDHPISFVYDASLAASDAEIVDPQALSGPVQLDPSGQLQCTSCHDAHDDTWPDFLLVDGSFSGLCTECHAKQGWAGATHDTSGAGWNGSGVDPWPDTTWTTVAANGCASCHVSHSAGSRERLLRFGTEEDNCLSCHAGSVARQDIENELRKTSTHPVQATQGVHDPREDFATMPPHVECEDCHDAHATISATAVAPTVSGALRESPGVSISGSPVEAASFQYEVCLRCHGDNPSQPPPSVPRLRYESNLRLEIDPAAASFHPIVAPGRNPNVPSLIAPWTESSHIYCTDCHANDAGPGAGGTGPAGPHGSAWPLLLEREYRTGDNSSESFQAYALCYKCHSRSSILADESFPEHRKHIVKENSPCSACHDPHGISAAQGSPSNSSHLIDFDISIVTADPGTGRLDFEDLGPGRGSCYLTCHGEVHKPETY